MVCYNKTLQSMDYEKICRMIIVFIVLHNKALQSMDYDKTFKKRLTLLLQANKHHTIQRSHHH